MDDSKFYRDWLDLNVPPGITPTYYQLLGLPHLEKQIPVIQAAVKSRMEHFRQIDFGEDRDAWQRLLQLLVEARFVLLTVELKREYDMRCSQEGKKQWQTYERPSRFTRLKQIGMVSAAFLLGLSVSLVMAMTVARNLDGTVKYTNSRSVAQKADWFTTPPGKDFPRPTHPMHRQLENNTPESKELAATVSEQMSKNAQTAELPNVSTPLVTAESEATVEPEATVEVRFTPRLRSNQQRRSPIHQFMAKEDDTPVPSNTSEVTPPLSETTPSLPGLVTSLPEVPATRENLLAKTPEMSVEMEEKEKKNVSEETLDSTIETTQDVSQQARELLENARDLPPENPDRTALFQKALDLAVRDSDVSLAFSILEAMKESYDLPMLALKQKTLQTLMEVLAKMAPTLQEKQPLEDLNTYGWKLCSELLDVDKCQEAMEISNRLYEITLSAQKSLGMDIEKTLKKKESYENFYTFYRNYIEAVQKLKTHPDDQQANRRVGVWYLQKKEDLQKALPYLAKSNSSLLQQLAQKELTAMASQPPRAENMLEIADAWWEAAPFFPKSVNETIYNHATAIYEKIDRERLDQGEQIRIAKRIEQQRK